MSHSLQLHDERVEQRSYTTSKARQAVVLSVDVARVVSANTTYVCQRFEFIE